MRVPFPFTLGLLALFLCTNLRGESSGEGLPVETATYRGVIFNPSLVTGSSPPWNDLLPADKKRITFWKPSCALIAKAEKALSSRLAEIQTDTPPQGFHFQEYYTPKYYSRDRVAHVPAGVYSMEFELLSDRMDEFRPPQPRQYIGITIDGKRDLVINFLGTPPAPDWKKNWAVAWHLYYLIGSGEFTPIQFNIEIEDR